MSQFKCDNCGHSPTPQEVLCHHGDCAKCGDTVIAYTVDAAGLIVQLISGLKSIRESIQTQTHVGCSCYSNPEEDCPYCAAGERIEAVFNDLLGGPKSEDEEASK